MLSTGVKSMAIEGTGLALSMQTGWWRERERGVERNCGERGEKRGWGVCDNNGVFAITIVVNGGVCDKNGGTKKFMECI